MKETDASDPARRTEYNVRDSDGTVVFSHGDVSGGTKWTMEAAVKLRKPMLHLDLDTHSARAAASRLLAWMEAERIEVLNVAGPRGERGRRHPCRGSLGARHCASCHAR